MKCPKCGGAMVESPGMLVIMGEGYLNGSKWLKCLMPECGHEEKVDDRHGATEYERAKWASDIASARLREKRLKAEEKVM